MQTGIVLADSFFESLRSMDASSFKLIHNNLKELADNPKTNGLKIHKIKKCKCDKSFRSARVTDDIRFILSQQGNQYIVLYVGKHDKAYNWADGKYFATSATGGLYLFDNRIADIKLAAPPSPDIEFPAFGSSKVGLLEAAGMSTAILEEMGIPYIHADHIMKISDEDVFLDYISIFPQEMQEILLDVVTGNLTGDEVIELINDSANKENTGTALHLDSQRRFITSTVDDIDDLLLLDYERWKVFLHPKQKYMVNKHYNGPVLIEGGPGTGKTIVGMHRIVHLAKNVYNQPDSKLLFCTFSRKLASYTSEQIKHLAVSEENYAKIDVMGVDQLLYSLVKSINPAYKIQNSEINDLLYKIWMAIQPPESLAFYQSEYREIIQKYRVRDEDSYLRINRRGMGKGLNPHARKKVWKFFDYFLEQKEKGDLHDFDDLAWFAFDHITSGRIEQKYDSIVIDESQDLSIPKLQAIISLLRTKADNLMIISDSNQRIFNLTGWRHDLKIKVVGRTYHLNLNYRTTRQIREFADHQFINSPKERDYLKGYKSLLNGPEPIIRDFIDKEEQYLYIVQQCLQYIKEGSKPYEICITSPVDLYKIESLLVKHGLNYTRLVNDIYPTVDAGICTATPEGCKGLEFRVVIAADYSEYNRGDIADLADDYHDLRVRRIECLRYVVATRAREVLIVTFVNND